MANVTNIRVLENGPRNYTLQVDGILDTSDVAQTVLVDTTAAGFQNSANNAQYGPAFTLKLGGAMYSIQDTLAVRFYWDATTPLLIAAYAGRNKEDYPSPIENDAGVGRTGKVLWDTKGWAAAAVLNFSVYLQFYKAFR